MLKKVLVTAAVTASAVGAMASPAMANDDEIDIGNANGAKTGYGNTKTGGVESPQMSLIQGTLNKPCLGIGKINLQGLVGAVPINLQDIPILTSQQQQQCTDNSTINDGDDPLSHLLDEIPIISGNGSGNSSAHSEHTEYSEYSEHHHGDDHHGH